MSLVNSSIEHHVGIITLNRADKRNALSQQMLAELISVASELDANNDVRLIKLCGEGEHFCAGADISEMRDSLHASPEANRASAARIAESMRALNSLRKPLISLVHGAAIGAGVGLACVADICVASEDAKFGLGEVKLGIIPSVIAPYVVAKIGEAQSRRYFVTGERISAERAREIGLVHEVVPHVALEAHAAHIIDAILEGGPAAVCASKKMVRDLVVGYSDKVLERTIETISDIRVTPEAQEGLTAFLEKRQPNWID